MSNADSENSGAFALHRRRAMRAGDAVRLRSPKDILATLDADGCLEGQPFMPEMLEHLGRSFHVSARVERACDTVTSWSGVRQLPKTVFLDDLRCSGEAHDGCQAKCRLYWKEAWLEPAGTKPSLPEHEAEGLAELKHLVTEYATAPDWTPEQPAFRCQATQLPQAGEIVGWWNVRSLLSELVNGNVTVWRYVRVSTRMVVEEIARRLFKRESRAPFTEAQLRASSAATTRPARAEELAPGDLVRVRSKEEILQTLDPNGRNRGLWFDREMLPYCGRAARVQSKVVRFIDEPTGRLTELKSDCYILEGCVCAGDRSIGRWFCCREIYPWWRSIWLEKLEEPVFAPSR